MKVRVLGCSGGIGARARTTSFLVDDDILLDAGTGVEDLSIAELAAIDHVFLTHSHLDHIAALPLLVDSVGSLRKKPIVVHALRETIDALRAGRSGEVQVEFTVAADGSVTSARVVRSNPPRVFDREAVAAVKRWRFEPTGAPVTTRRTIGFNPGGG